MKRIADRSKKYLAVICFFVFTVCLYGPFSLYFQNAEEFWFTLKDFAIVVLPVSLITVAVLFLLSIVLPETKGHIMIKLLFGITLGMYIQGNYININYGSGVLDGSEIIWSDYTTYAIWDTIAWIVCLAVPFIIDIVIKHKDKLFYKTITAISLFLIAIQVPAFASQALTYNPSSDKDFIISTDGMFEMGEKENILIFVLDSMDESYYQTFIDTHEEYTKELKGFIHYDDVATAGSRTIIGLPAMFTGEPFTRNELYSEYLHRIWSQPNAFSVLHDAGYKVSVYAETLTFSADAVNYIANFQDGRGEVGSAFEFGKKIYKMDLYKYAPHAFKYLFWFYTGEFEEIRETTKANPYIEDDFVFYESFMKDRFSVNPSVQKNVQVYCLAGAHEPYKMNEYGEKVDKSTRQDQVAGQFYCLQKMLQDLKDKNLYDDTMIIITADHGDRNVSQYPIFLLKEAGSVGEYCTSSAPLSLFDLPIYLSSYGNIRLSNDYGKPIEQVKEGEIRERHMFNNTSGNSRITINEYMTTGKTGDFKSWQLVNEYEDPTSSSTEYRLGTVLYFNTEATGNIYTTEGFGNNTGYQTKLYGPYSSLRIPIEDLPETGSLKVDFVFHTKPKYPYEINANDVMVFDSSKQEKKPGKEISVEIPVELLEPGNELAIDICFPEIDMAEMDKTAKQRTLTAGLFSLNIYELVSEQTE